jgi:hypothetical protein
VLAADPTATWLSRVATAPVPMAVEFLAIALECAPMDVDWKPVASAW